MIRDCYAIRLVCGLSVIGALVFIAALVALAATDSLFFGAVVAGLLAIYPIGYAVERVVLK